eukprot:10540318-Lingulodinium_polyedra.AAC.1
MSVSVGSWPFGSRSLRRSWQAPLGRTNGRTETFRLRPVSGRATTEQRPKSCLRSRAKHADVDLGRSAL